MQNKEIGIIYLWGDINDKAAIDIIEDLHDLFSHNKNAHIYINSDGGNIESAISIIDTMTYLQARGMIIDTIVLGRACSAAVNILIYGNTRYATNNSIFMIHQSHYELPGDYDHIQKATVDFWSKKCKEFLDDVVLRLKPKYQAVAYNRMKSGYWLDSHEAIKIGLINKIWK